jgi:CRP-like cAMP-binding protein
MIEKHLQVLRARDSVSAEEEAAIRAAVGDVVRIPADKTVIEPGTLLDRSTLVLEGMMARFKDLSQGQRQIVELHIAGDFIDLHSFTLKKLDHGIMTLTPCLVAHFPHANLREITREHPHLTRMFWLMTNIDAAIQREWTVSLGRRSAIQRAAHFFCEMEVRLGVVGLAGADCYPLQMTQIELGECLGLTSVHVNRVLKELRERGLMEFRGSRVTIQDRAGLARLAEFDPAYLHLEQIAR